METISASLALCAPSRVTGEVPAQRPVTRSFDERLSKHPRGWWFETPSRPLWRHNNGLFLILRSHVAIIAGYNFTKTRRWGCPCGTKLSTWNHFITHWSPLHYFRESSLWYCWIIIDITMKRKRHHSARLIMWLFRSPNKRKSAYFICLKTCIGTSHLSSCIPSRLRITFPISVLDENNLAASYYEAAKVVCPYAGLP